MKQQFSHTHFLFLFLLITTIISLWAPIIILDGLVQDDGVPGASPPAPLPLKAGNNLNSSSNSSTNLSPSSPQQMVVPDRTKAVGPCVDRSGTPSANGGGRCPSGYFCFASECYPNAMMKKEGGAGGGGLKPLKLDKSSLLLLQNNGQQQQDGGGGGALGPCINNLCPGGYDCRKNKCYKAKSAIGTCVNGRCPEGFTCDPSDNICLKN